MIPKTTDKQLIPTHREHGAGASSDKPSQAIDVGFRFQRYDDGYC